MTNQFSQQMLQAIEAARNQFVQMQQMRLAQQRLLLEQEAGQRAQQQLGLQTASTTANILGESTQGGNVTIPGQAAPIHIPSAQERLQSAIARERATAEARQSGVNAANIASMGEMSKKQVEQATADVDVIAGKLNISKDSPQYTHMLKQKLGIPEEIPIGTLFPALQSSGVKTEGIPPNLSIKGSEAATMLAGLARGESYIQGRIAAVLARPTIIIGEGGRPTIVSAREAIASGSTPGTALNPIQVSRVNASFAEMDQTVKRFSDAVSVLESEPIHPLIATAALADPENFITKAIQGQILKGTTKKQQDLLFSLRTLRQSAFALRGVVNTASQGSDKRAELLIAELPGASDLASGDPALVMNKLENWIQLMNKLRVEYSEVLNPTTQQPFSPNQSQPSPSGKPMRRYNPKTGRIE